MGEFGWAYVKGAQAGGPAGAVQFAKEDKTLDGNSSFTFEQSSGVVNLTGTLNISGGINANFMNIDVTNKVVHKVEQYGATKFGDSFDDLHQRTGSLEICSGSIALHANDSTSGSIRMESSGYMYLDPIGGSGENSVVILGDLIVMDDQDYGTKKLMHLYDNDTHDAIFSLYSNNNEKIRLATDDISSFNTSAPLVIGRDYNVNTTASLFVTASAARALEVEGPITGAFFVKGKTTISGAANSNIAFTGGEVVETKAAFVVSGAAVVTRSMRIGEQVFATSLSASSYVSSSQFYGTSGSFDGINIGNLDQAKIIFNQATDDLEVSGKYLSAKNNLRVQAGGYVSFGDTDTSSGYGLRDNSGVVEYKNNGGEWRGLIPGSGAVNSLQINTDDRSLTGSANLTYLTSSNTLNLTGTLNVSGAINANEINVNVLNKTVTNIDQYGSTKFGDSSDDTHQFTGSMYVATSVSSSALYATQLSASNYVSASNLYGDGSSLTGIPIKTYTNASNNRVLTSVNSSTVNGEANLTFDGTDLTVAGGGSVYTDKIRRASDSGTTTKILLNDEVLKLYAGHSSNEVVNIQSGIVDIEGSLTSSTYVSASAFWGVSGSYDEVNIGNSQEVKLKYNSSSETLEVSGKPLLAKNNLQLESSGYLNFGATNGASGIGFRNNSGDMQFKNNGGAWMNLQAVCTGSGADHSLQFKRCDTSLTGAAELTFNTGSNTLTLSGTLNVSGTINANAINLAVVNKTVTNVNQYGSTKFGDSSDDTHQFTGSMYVVTSVSSSALYATQLSASNYVSASNLYINSGAAINITASSHVSASTFYGDGSNLTGLDVAVNSYTNPTNNRVLTSVDSETINGEANLTFDGSILNVVGSLTSSTYISSSAFWGVSGSYDEVNIGNSQQTKLKYNSTSDSLEVTGKVLYAAANLRTSEYVNFSAVNGSGGFGIRNNSGVIEVKNNGGAWAEIGSNRSRVRITATHTASATNQIIGVSASSAIDVRLPNASVLESGHVYTIKDESGNAGTYVISIKASGSQTIDGYSEIALESPYAAVNVYSDGVSKYFIY